MKRSKWWIVLYVLAAIIVVGRLGVALSAPDHFWMALFKIDTSSGGQSLGFMIEGFIEDYIVGVSIWSLLRKPKDGGVTSEIVP
jgi:hypothetical protein